MSKTNLVLFFLLLSFIFQVMWVIRNYSPTSDEPGHLLAGYNYLIRGYLRFNVGAPLLLNVFSVLPLLFLNLPDPALSSFWQSGYIHGVARDFFWALAGRVDTVLFWGRLPILLLALILMATVYCFSKNLYGRKAAVMALGLFAFEPNFITHSD